MEYTYDKNNRVKSIAHPTVSPNPLAVGSFGYDEVGNLLWKRYGTEPATLYRYDDLNRLTDIWYSFSGSLVLPITYPSANPDVQYTYVGGSRLRNTVTNLYDGVNSYVSQYTYDLMDRLQTYIPPAPNGHGAISYTYNNLGQKKTVTNGSLVVGYDYYANGWLKRVNRDGNLVSKYTLDAAGNRTLVNLANGTSTTYNYGEDLVPADLDPRYRVSRIIHNVVGTPSSYTISYPLRDGAGNPMTVTDWNGTVGYTYDVYSRLSNSGQYVMTG